MIITIEYWYIIIYINIIVQIVKNIKDQQDIMKNNI